MRRLLTLLAFALVLLTFPLTCHFAPALTRWAGRPPGYTPERPAAMRRAARETIVRYEARYGPAPVAEWPEHARAAYEMAKKMLAADDDAGPDN